MVKIRLLVLCSILLLISCEEKKDFELTFYKWNIHEDYYLKLNSSDTVFLIIDNPIEKKTAYAILNEEEKEKFKYILLNAIFPDKEEFSNNVDDGLSYVFLYKTHNQKKQLYIHAHAGPKEFWEFGNFLQTIKDNHKFIAIKKKINLKEIQKLMTIPIPPKIN